MPSFPTRFLRPRAPAAGRARERWGQGPDGSAPTAGTVLTSPSEEEQQGGYSDTELLRLARTGNIEAFRVVYKRHGAAALLLADQIVGDPEMAVTVTHKAFHSLWRSTASYDAEAESVSAWVLRVTRVDRRGGTAQATCRGRACHFFGRRRFDTDDHSRNLLWLAPLSFGESWHNNHHAFPTSARHGLRPWEIDTSAILIRALESMGLAWDVVRVSGERQAARAGAPSEA